MFVDCRGFVWSNPSSFDLTYSTQPRVTKSMNEVVHGVPSLAVRSLAPLGEPSGEPRASVHRNVHTRASHNPLRTCARQSHNQTPVYGTGRLFCRSLLTWTRLRRVSINSLRVSVPILNLWHWQNRLSSRSSLFRLLKSYNSMKMTVPRSDNVMSCKGHCR